MCAFVCAWYVCGWVPVFVVRAVPFCSERRWTYAGGGDRRKAKDNGRQGDRRAIRSGRSGVRRGRGGRGHWSGCWWSGQRSLPPKANQCAESLRASELCNSSMHWLETATELKREKRYGLSVAVSGWQDLAGSTRGAGGAGLVE